MQKNITIAPATEADVPGIQQVFYKTWIATYVNKEHGITLEDLKHRYKDAFTEERYEQRRKMIHEKTDDELFLVAKDGENVVGICYAEILEHNNNLRAMYILPEYQGQGIGTRFWNEATKFFDPKKDIIANVATFNTNAIAFYKKLGFEDTGKRFTEERFRMKSGSILPELEMRIKV